MIRRRSPRRAACALLCCLLSLLPVATDTANAAALERASSSGAAPAAAAPAAASTPKVAAPAAAAPAAASTPKVAAPAAPAPFSPYAIVPGLTPARELELRTMASRLRLSYPLLLQAVAGLEDLCARRYAEARTRFRTLERTHPTSAIGPFGISMLLQAQMAENLDFRQEALFNQMLKETRRRTDEAISRGDAPAWNHFLRASALGMNSIYQYRKDRVMGAVQDAWSALNDLEAARKLEPSFVDPALGLGLYDYWYSVVARRYKLLKGVPDKRKEGIRQMEDARDHGVLSPALARLALVYTYVEDRKPKQALPEAEALYALYPENVLNLQMLGQIQTRMKRIDLARQYYAEVLRIDPRNYQVYYFLGNLEFTRGGDLEKARTYLAKFVNEEPDNDYETIGRLRLGDTYWLLGDATNAERQWAIALKDSPESRIAQQRARGKRPYPRTKRQNP